MLPATEVMGMAPVRTRRATMWIIVMLAIVAVIVLIMLMSGGSGGTGGTY